MLIFSFKFEQHILKLLIWIYQSKPRLIAACDTFWPLPTPSCKDATRSSRKLVTVACDVITRYCVQILPLDRQSHQGGRSIQIHKNRDYHAQLAVKQWSSIWSLCFWGGGEEVLIFGKCLPRVIVPVTSNTHCICTVHKYTSYFIL